MGILISEELTEELTKKLKKARKKVDIITAFCKVESLKYIDTYIAKNIKKRILVRFRLSDLLMGITDIELFEYCKNNNWELYINTNMHAKIYVADDICYIGSANLTNSGLSIEKKGNIEGTYRFEIQNEKDNQTLENLFEQSIELDESLYEKMKNDYHENEKITNKEVKWNKDIEKKLKENFDVLLIKDFPINEYPNNMKTDEIFLGIKAKDNLAEIKKKFEKTKIMRWLISVLESKENKEIYFGELSEMIHFRISKKAEIHRKDVKILQCRLFNWLMILDYEYFDIDKVNYSTKIKLTNK